MCQPGASKGRSPPRGPCAAVRQTAREGGAEAGPPPAKLRVRGPQAPLAGSLPVPTATGHRGAQREEGAQRAGGARRTVASQSFGSHGRPPAGLASLSLGRSCRRLQGAGQPPSDGTGGDGEGACARSSAPRPDGGTRPADSQGRGLSAEGSVPRGPSPRGPQALLRLRPLSWGQTRLASGRHTRLRAQRPATCARVTGTLQSGQGLELQKRKPASLLGPQTPLQLPPPRPPQAHWPWHCGLRGTVPAARAPCVTCSHTLTHTHTRSHSHPCTLTRSLTHTQPYTLTHPRSLTHSQSHTRSHTLTCSHTFTHIHTPTPHGLENSWGQPCSPSLRLPPLRLKPTVSANPPPAPPHLQHLHPR